MMNELRFIIGPVIQQNIEPAYVYPAGNLGHIVYHARKKIEKSGPFADDASNGSTPPEGNR